MRPIKLTMSAYGPYADVTVVDFEKLGDEGLYLVTGDTGAGKTTVFDAISFALFGEASGNDRPVQTLRSDFAAPDAETYVELEFEYRTKRYRVWRCPAYRRAKRRGSGTTEQAADIVFERPGFPPITKVRDANAAIEELLGIDRNQFSQIVMIAQGDFRKLLTATTAERSTIFRKLFATQDCQTFQSKLKEFESAARKEVEASRLESASIARSLSLPDSPPENVMEALDALGSGEDPAALKRAADALVLNDARSEPEASAKANALREELDAAKRDHDRMQQARQVRATLLECRRLEREQEERLRRSEKEFERTVGTKPRREALSAQAAAIEARLEDYEKLDAAKRDLAASAQARERSARAVDGARETCGRLRALLASQEEELAALEGADVEFAEAKAGMEASRTRLAEARASLDEALALEKAAEEERKASQMQKAASSAASQATEAREKAQSALARAQRELEEVQSAPAEAERAEAAVKEAANELAKADEALRKIGEAERRAQDATEQARTLRSEYERAYGASADAERAWSSASKRLLDEQAGVIGATLSEGMPCPVCGSIDHPCPARPAASDVTSEKVESLELEWRAAREEAEKRSMEASKAMEKETQLLDALRTLEAETGGGSKKAMAAREAAARRLQEAKSEHASARARLEEMRKRSERVVEATSELEQARENEASCARSLADAQADARAASAHASALQSASKGLDVGASKSALLQAEEDMTEWTNRTHCARTNRDRFAKTKDMAAKTKSDLDSANLAREEAEAKEAEAKELFATCTARSESLAESLDHASRTEAETSLAHMRRERDRLAKEEEDARASLEDARKGLASLSARAKALEEQSASLGTFDETEVEKRLERCRSAVEAAEKAKTALASRLHANRTALSRAKDLEKESEKAESALSDLMMLSTTASGAIPGKARVSFETYVQARYLDLVLVAANRRLRSLTDGRFELTRRREANSLRGQVGLDLDVMDHYTGKERDASSLSGGESFKASLSLALGLSDVVQEHAGGIQLDTMFVDEGFGSLDQESLRLAVNTLSELSSSGKLVGVISHVEELKESIDRKIVVKKGRDGSKLSIEC